MEKLEEKIKKQVNNWKKDKFNHSMYYISNIIKLTFGYEQSHVSPNNILVNSYIHGIDN